MNDGRTGPDARATAVDPPRVELAGAGASSSRGAAGSNAGIGLLTGRSSISAATCSTVERTVSAAVAGRTGMKISSAATAAVGAAGSSFAPASTAIVIGSSSSIGSPASAAAGTIAAGRGRAGAAATGRGCASTSFGVEFFGTLLPGS